MWVSRGEAWNDASFRWVFFIRKYSWLGSHCPFFAYHKWKDSGTRVRSCWFSPIHSQLITNFEQFHSELSFPHHNPDASSEGPTTASWPVCREDTRILGARFRSLLVLAGALHMFSIHAHTHCQLLTWLTWPSLIISATLNCLLPFPTLCPLHMLLFWKDPLPLLISFR